MRVKSLWWSGVAALALAAPGFAGRTDSDDANLAQEPAPAMNAGSLTADEVSMGAQRTIAPAQPAASADAQAPAPEQPAAPAGLQEPTASPQTAPSESQTPAAGTQAATPEPAVAAPAESELPRTASPLALLALLGLGSAGSAAGVRAFRRR